METSSIAGKTYVLESTFTALLSEQLEGVVMANIFRSDSYAFVLDLNKRSGSERLHTSVLMTLPAATL